MLAPSPNKHENCPLSFDEIQIQMVQTRMDVYGDAKDVILGVEASGN